MKGQANNWYPPARRREEQRAQLRREASKILSADPPATREAASAA
jgi:hypothetical protein